MKYNVSVIKKIAFLVMTMALAVAMVACQAAAPGKAGEAGAPGEPGEPAPRLPYLNTGFADVELAATGVMATMSITLASHFVDPHEGELTYSASSEPSDVVETSVSGSTLTLTAVKEGTATVTVGAENKDGASAFNPGAQFTVTVMETVAPMVTEGGIPDQTLYKDDSPVALTLTKADADSMGYFTHDSAITYDVSSSPAGFVTAVEAEGVLTLTPLVTGQTIVTVEATADSKKVTVTFTVDVMAGSKPIAPPEGPAAPMPKGTIPNMDLTVGGEPGTVDASDYFTGEMLKYSVVSDAEDIATVKYSKSTVTVTAVAKGFADITITAMNDSGTATQDFTVEVMASEPKNEPPTKTGIGSQSLRPGQTDTINLDIHFSDPEGGALDYDVTSNAPDTVMATETDGILTLEAMMVGTATITVEATDDADNMVSDRFTVTVEFGCETTIDLFIDGDPYECTLPDTYSLSYFGDNVVASPKSRATGNVWLITAKKTGDAKVHILDESGARIGSITVTVVNRRPMRNQKSDPYILFPVAVVEGETPDYTVAVTTTDGATAGLDLATYFSDQDGDTLTYKVDRSRNGKVLFKVDDKGYIMPAEGNYTLQVFSVAPGVHYFEVDFAAYDGAGEKSDDTVTIRLEPPMDGVVLPAPPKEIEQDPDGKLKVGSGPSEVEIDGRLGAMQRIIFKIDGSPGFRFAQLAAEKYVTEGKLHDDQDDHAGTASAVIEKPVNTPATPVSGSAPAGVGYYSIKVLSGPATADWPEDPENHDLATDPKIIVTPSAPGIVRISITYHTWVNGAGNRNTPTPESTTMGTVWDMESEMLTVKVKNCVTYGCK